MFAVSVAKSVSRIRLRASLTFSETLDWFLIVDSRRFCTAPSSARLESTVEMKPSMFSRTFWASSAVAILNTFLPDTASVLKPVAAPAAVSVVSTAFPALATEATPSTSKPTSFWAPKAKLTLIFWLASAPTWKSTWPLEPSRSFSPPKVVSLEIRSISVQSC